MLKSTGYFRAIECPFGESCRRPYCHFRHRGRGVWASTPGEARTGAEYNPYSPDLRKGSLCLDGVLEVVPEPGLDILELERVNKAIEAVKSEVEREQKKYEELLETQKDYNVATSKPKNPFSHLEYDPGCYGGSGTYNPTPLSRSRKGSKYTLDDGDRSTHKTKCLEYVPTAVTKAPKAKTNKYVIDNSKPPTDMEYDPMSNYSARLLSKDKQQRTKRDRLDGLDEGYSPSPKKMCNSVYEVSVDARFSESDGDTEPVVLKSASKSFYSKKTHKASAKSPKYAAVEKKSKAVKEIAVQYNMDDIEKPLKNHSKSSKDSKHKSKNETKTVPKEQPKLRKSENNIDSAKELKGKSKIPGKGKSENVKNGENQAGHKLKTKSSKSEKNSEKQILAKDQVKGSSSHIKNEKLDKKHKKDQKNKKYAHSKSGDARNGKVKEKSNSITPSGIKVKSKQRTLSHVDLFGDESSEAEDAVKVRKLGLHRSSLGSDGGGHSDTEGESSMKISKRNHRRVSTSSGDSVAIDYSALENEFDLDSDPMEECLRVFNESQEVKTEDKGRMGKQSQEKTEQTLATIFPGQKRRISHVIGPNSSVSASKPVVRPYHRPTPQEICYQRIQLAQEQATQLLAQKKKLQLNSTELSSFSIRHSKNRIAHLPGSRSSTSSSCQLVSSETKTLENSEIDKASKNSAQSLKIRTLTGMTSKTTSTVAQKRQAHVPSLQSATLKRPVIPTEFGAKVPTTIRQRYLNLFIDECLKFSCTEQEAFDKALEEEKIVYNRSSSRNIYLNMAVNALTKLRSKGQGTKPVTSERTNKRVTSHESVLGGKKAAKTSYSMQRNTGHQAEELTDVLLFTKLKEYILTPDQLQLHGYPVAHPDKPGRVILTAEEKKTDSSCRVCCRCGAEYLVVPSGKCLRREECVHHWGRLRRQKVSGGWETLYNCCSGAVGSTGCQVAKQHVHNRKEPQDGFVKTLEKPPTEDGNSGVYALDCEMCYTTQGLELTRVTVINSHLKVVYDTFVKPENAIVDYNTRFSGVTEEDMQNTTTSLRDVQAVLLSMFSSDTILIGHSLESDLFALKLIHQVVVDTAIVFPHHLGLPYKRALRSLMADYLKRIIQDSVDGHDSSEDACSCMELMKWKLKEDAKVKR